MSSRRLAIQASKRLLDVADNLCEDTSCVQFCASLKFILVGIIKWLEDLPDNANSEKEAVELLEQLDNLCRDVSSGPIRAERIDTALPTSKTPSLGVRHLFAKIREKWTDTASPISKSRPGGVGQISPDAEKERTGAALPIHESRYLDVGQLMANAAAATLAVRNLASDRKSQRRRKTTIVCLQSFLPQISNDDQIDISPSNTDLRAAREDLPEFGKEILSLYKALSANCFCPESEEVIARIRLCGSSQGDDTGITFGMLFMAHSHKEPQPLWQDAHILVQPTVKFGGSNNAAKEIRIDSDMTFCSCISTQHEDGPTLLKLLVEGKRLYFQEFLEPLRQWEFYKPSISLGQLLKEVSLSADNLTGKRKEVLSWLLAKATWQYYDSPWMLQPWNKESVHFLSEKRWTEEGHQLDGIFVNDPLLSISIVPNPPVAENTEANSQRKAGAQSNPKHHRSPLRGPLHPMPKILALGIMLIEIQLCSPIESLYRDPKWSQYCPEGKPHRNTNFKICRDLIAKKSFFEIMEIPDPLEDLIKACIQPPDEFRPPHARDEDIRGALYVLVNRLEVYISNCKPWSIKPLSLSRDGRPNDPHTTRSLVQIPLQPAPENEGEHLRPGRIMSQMHASLPYQRVTELSKNLASTKSWFKRLESLNYILKAADDDPYEKVKIAVLDTGVDPSDAAAAYIAGYRDLVAGDDSIKCDNTGHGTTLINLIFDMCEMASVYVVRIFDTDEANEETQALAIQAIDWCITQKMDVICMACGFNEYDERLHKKIRDASDRMLIFAAPTNEGNAGQIAYPAQFDSHVFCMFSTDGYITNSRRLNPTTRDGHINFAILGEDIKTLSGEAKSGTSFSTAIAAGLAGRLLEFSRHRDCQGRIRNASMMNVKDGMTKIFKAMAIKDGHFNCLKPWLLLPEHIRSQIPFDNFPTKETQTRTRDDIRDLITRSLNKG